MKRTVISQAIHAIYNSAPDWLDSAGTRETIPYPRLKIAEAGVDLSRFSSDDYYHSTHFDIYFVRRGSKLAVWLALALDSAR